LVTSVGWAGGDDYQRRKQLEAVERSRLGQEDGISTLQRDLQAAQEKRAYEGQLEMQQREALKQVNEYKYKLTRARQVPLVKIV
jgi:hypothetical protein